jgi:uncharacterized protein (UPF0303 family)
MMKNKFFKSCVLCFFLFNISTATAVAPRITQDMFGQEVTADILAYESMETSQASQIGVEIVKQAFAEEGIILTIDVEPSKQLALYSLFNGDLLGLIGQQSDLASFDDADYFNLVFYIHDDGAEKIPFALYVDKRADDAEKLFASFKQGLLKSLENQTYSKIITDKSGKGELINYKDLLQHYNDGL